MRCCKTLWASIGLFPLLPLCANDEVIVVTANRTALSELESTYSIAVIDEEKIANKGYRSTVEAMRNVSGVLLQKTAHGQGSPYIRGFTGFRNLFLVDGIRLNNSTFREGPNQYWNTVDAFSINRFEIVKGPTSVAYGSDAIGGTVNALTQLQTLDDINTQFANRLFYRGSSAGQSTVLRSSHQQLINQHYGISLGATYKKFGDLIAGGTTNEQPYTGYDEFNIDVKLLAELTEDWQLSTAYFKTKQDAVPRTHKTVHGISFAGTTLGNELARETDQERELFYVKLEGKELNGVIDNANFTLSYQNQNEQRYRLRTNNREDQRGVDVNTLGLNINVDKTFDHSYLLVGIESYFDNVSSFSSRNSIQGPVADDASYDWHGLYGMQTFFLSQHTNVDVGLRWNYMAVEANEVSDPTSGAQIQIKDNWQNLIGNIRLNHQIVPNKQSVFIGLSQGFRAPNLSDLTRFDSARSNEFEIPSPELEPEHYLTLDTGIKYRSQTLDYNIALYYTHIKDQIQRVPTGIINADGEFQITKFNIGEGYAYGGEFDINYQINSALTVFANIAYINGKVDTFIDSTNNITREYMSRLMPTNARVGGTYQTDINWWFTGEVITFDKADRLSNRDKGDTQRIPPNGTPSFSVVNISGGYTVNEALSVTINIDNLLDKNYRIHGSGQNEAGLNVIASIAYQF